ncbi:MAG: LLM class flavin-dependent oxidoreductase [Gammaproteobacteria bacterium]|nr:LLM class flavin-dependent oxidoreductase [Gammaproteobacteria bacterium]
MRFGVAISGVPDPVFPEEVAGLEKAGFGSLWFGLDGADWDPIVLASATAMATTGAELVVALAAPTPVTAKSVASLDALCGGRSRILVETAGDAALMRAMLGGDLVGYDGARFRVVDAPVLPAPVQEQVPIWTRVADLAGRVDGWLATGVEAYEARAGTVDQACRDVGKDPALLRRAVLVDARGRRVTAALFSVTSGELVRRLRGVDEVVLQLDRQSWRVAGEVASQIQ